MTLRLVYWDIRGIAEPIRHMLRYRNIEWIDERLSSDMEGYRKYMEQCRNPRLILGNLPYIRDGEDTYVTQSLACMRYVGRKLNIMPDGATDVVLCEMVEQEVLDLKTKMTEACYSPYQSHTPGVSLETEGKHDFHFLRKRFSGRLKSRIGLLQDLIRDEYLIGDQPLYVDFIMYEFMDQFHAFAPEAFDEDAKPMLDYMGRMERLKGIREWLEGEGAKPQFINAPLASWHGMENEAMTQRNDAF